MSTTAIRTAQNYVTKEPYYQPLGDEVKVFAAAYHNQLPVAGLLGVTLCTEVLLLLIQSRTAPSPPGGAAEAAAETGNTEMIGEALYSTYLFPFEVASLILLVAMIGAIILAKKDIIETTE